MLALWLCSILHTCTCYVPTNFLLFGFFHIIFSNVESTLHKPGLLDFPVFTLLILLVVTLLMHEYEYNSLTWYSHVHRVVEAFDWCYYYMILGYWFGPLQGSKCWSMLVGMGKSLHSTCGTKLKRDWYKYTQYLCCVFHFIYQNSLC